MRTEPRDTLPDRAASLLSILRADSARPAVLRVVEAPGLPDCWVGAGFPRDAAWDALHGRRPAPPLGDVDVIWFDPSRVASTEDRAIEARLGCVDDRTVWSVKNQARMHGRNGDAPYGSAIDAVRRWPETATAVAVRMHPDGGLELAAPHGLDDLFDLVIRPTPHFSGAKRGVVSERVREKRWLRT